MASVFSPGSTYKKWARFVAVLWTLLIFIGCFTPGKDLPEVHIHLIDKYVHFILFGGFAFFWLCAYPSQKFSRYVAVLLAAALLGTVIEILQGIFVSLGRSCEVMDGVADCIGAVLGCLLFGAGAYFYRSK